MSEPINRGLSEGLDDNKDEHQTDPFIHYAEQQKHPESPAAFGSS